ncbi:hypothetical protein FOE78_11965 [Microlunatus elymi]|uniref:Uncharacterized protein n=1 Tax=Microlunatus elymi TaxID=2596828 RepID=A0A516PZC9_9ACTN|nr:hypothetical protein [Microlunatus elymi]QDP96524.1 hypothetical protein FOE78_11965 [Microlunatus elymi]
MIQIVTRVALSVGAFLMLASCLLLLAVKPGTSEFVITIINLIMGATMIAIGVFAARLVTRRASSEEEQ